MEARNCETAAPVVFWGACAATSSTPTSDSPLLKPQAVAERLQVSRSWVYTAAAAGRIPSVRLGGPDGPLRFVQADLEQWLAAARASWTPGR